MLKASEIIRCGSCIACLRPSDCQKCDNCINNVNSCVRRICVQASIIAADQAPNGSVDRLQSGKRDSTDGRKKGRKKEKKDAPGPGRKPKQIGVREKDLATEAKDGNVVVRQRKPHKPHKPHVWLPKELRLPKNRKNGEIAPQCYGPNCVKAARLGSKYCCDECGLKMADDRLRRILPVRVRDYYSIQPLAEKEDDKRIRDLTIKKALAEGELEQSNQFALTLELYIGTLAKMEPTVQNRHQTSGGDMSIIMNCGVCGKEFPLNIILQHINECYVHLEQKYAYGSKNPSTENPHDLICEEFDAQTGTYCKRLRFACSEHYSDNLGSQMKCCGYPLQWTVLNSVRLPDLFATLETMLSGGICTRNRWHCKDHRFWEQNIRALLDSHRIRLINYLEEISSSYHRVAEAYRTRGDALTLLTNWRKTSAETQKQEEEIHNQQKNGLGYSTDGSKSTKAEEQSVEALYKTIISLSRASRYNHVNPTIGSINSSSLLSSGLLSKESVPGELLSAPEITLMLNENLTTIGNNISSLADESNRVLNNGQFVLSGENVLEHLTCKLPVPLKIE